LSIGRPVHDEKTEIDEISGVVRDQRCPQPARKRGNQQVGVVARSTPASLIRPEVLRRPPT
jgi:hypothetical protein